MTSEADGRSSYQRMAGEEALAFDLGTFLKANKNAKDLKIRGHFIKDNEVIRLSFNKADWDGKCYDFCTETVEVTKLPLMGVATVPADETGVEVQRVIANSAASLAGVMAGDVIANIEGEPVHSGCDLTSIIAVYEPEDALDVEVVRNGKMETLQVVLGYKIQRKQVWTACCQPIAADALENIETEDLSLGNLEVFPNPTTGIAQIKYRSEVNGSFDMQVTDVTGRILHQISRPEFKGYFDEAIDLTGQAAGIYFLHIIHDGQRRTEKLVVQGL